MDDNMELLEKAMVSLEHQATIMRVMQIRIMALTGTNAKLTEALNAVTAELERLTKAYQMDACGLDDDDDEEDAPKLADGPCENHIEVLVQREGGNTRTADQLNSLFISDAVDLGVVLSASDAVEMAKIDALLEEDHWLPFDIDIDWGDVLVGIRFCVESDLCNLYYERGEHLFVNFEDGYVIGKILPGSPLLK